MDPNSEFLKGTPVESKRKLQSVEDIPAALGEISKTVANLADKLHAMGKDEQIADLAKRYAYLLSAY